MLKGTVCWLPPRLRVGEDDESERHATWLELFYDLIFVVAVAELGKRLGQDVSLNGFLAFSLLFVPIWWAWMGATYYATRFDTDDIGDRLLTLLQMFGVVALAVSVNKGTGATSVAFALSYAIMRTGLIFQYVRAGHYARAALPLTRYYATGFSIAAALWLVSVFVPIPYRFIFWVVGLVVDIATPISAGRLHIRIPPHISHLPERFGLFIIIVLGESVAGVVRGLSGHSWTPYSMTAAVFGLVILFSIWWIYFTDTEHSSIITRLGEGHVNTYQIWIYSHLPLALGVTAAAVGIEHVVLKASGMALTSAERWLFCGSVAMSLFAMGLILMAIHVIGTATETGVKPWHLFLTGALVLALSAIAANLPPILLIGTVSIACALHVILFLYRVCR